MTIKEFCQQFDGMDADQIAAKLLRDGHKGKCESVLYCPIATAMKSCGLELVSVTEDHLKSYPFAEKTPRNIRDFIICFDRGFYPKLVKEKT